MSHERDVEEALKQKEIEVQQDKHKTLRTGSVARRHRPACRLNLGSWRELERLTCVVSVFLQLHRLVHGNNE